MRRRTHKTLPLAQLTADMPRCASKRAENPALGVRSLAAQGVCVVGRGGGGRVCRRRACCPLMSIWQFRGTRRLRYVIIDIDAFELDTRYGPYRYRDIDIAIRSIWMRCVSVQYEETGPCRKIGKHSWKTVGKLSILAAPGARDSCQELATLFNAFSGKGTSQAPLLLLSACRSHALTEPGSSTPSAQRMSASLGAH